MGSELVEEGGGIFGVAAGRVEAWHVCSENIPNPFNKRGQKTQPAKRVT